MLVDVYMCLSVNRIIQKVVDEYRGKFFEGVGRVTKLIRIWWDPDHDADAEGIK